MTQTGTGTAHVNDGPVRVEEYEGLLLLRSADNPAPTDGLDTVAAALRSAGDRTVTLLADAGATAEPDFWPRLGRLLDALRASGHTGVRLAMTGAGEERPGQPAPARRIADSWAITVEAPAGPVQVVAGGSLYAPLGPDGRGGWLGFAPGATPVPLGARCPRPVWQSVLDAVPRRTPNGYVVEHIPAGLLLRPGQAAVTAPGDPYHALPVDPRGPTVVVDAPPGDASLWPALGRLLGSLPPEARAGTALQVRTTTHVPGAVEVLRELETHYGLRTVTVHETRGGTTAPAPGQEIVHYDRAAHAPATTSAPRGIPSPTTTPSPTAMPSTATPDAALSPAATPVSRSIPTPTTPVTTASRTTTPAPRNTADPTTAPAPHTTPAPSGIPSTATPAAMPSSTPTAAPRSTADPTTTPEPHSIPSPTEPPSTAAPTATPSPATATAPTTTLATRGTPSSTTTPVPRTTPNTVAAPDLDAAWQHLGRGRTPLPVQEPQAPDLPPAPDLDLAWEHLSRRPATDAPSSDGPALQPGVHPPRPDGPTPRPGIRTPRPDGTGTEPVRPTTARSALRAGYRSSPAEHTALRLLAGPAWERHAGAVARALGRLPALADVERDAAEAELTALRLYLDDADGLLDHRALAAACHGRDDRLLPFAACLVSALRRLPTQRGAVLRGAGSALPVEEDPETDPLRPGTVLRDNAPLSGVPAGAGDGWPRGPRYAIWSVTGRLSRRLFDEPAEEAGREEVVFAPGTPFMVLDVRRTGPSPVVLLRELPASGGAPALAAGKAARAELGEADRAALAGLDEALRGRTAQSGSGGWSERCAGPVGEGP